MPNARVIRQQLLQAESPRLKVREEAILTVIAAANRWTRAAERAAEAERELHARTAAAVEHMGPDELAEFAELPAKDVRNWARLGAAQVASDARSTARGKRSPKARNEAVGSAHSGTSRTGNDAGAANLAETLGD